MSMLLKKNKIKLNSGEVDFAIDSLQSSPLVMERKEKKITFAAFQISLDLEFLDIYQDPKIPFFLVKKK